MPRLQATTTLLGNGKALVAGGRTFDFTQALNSAELYNQLTETFTLTGAMTDARWSHTATRLANGKVLVAGGYTNPASSANAQPVLTSAELYDPATGTWSPTGSMATRRALHVAQLLPNGKVLVAGGRTCNGPPPLTCNSTFTTNTAELYDPATGTWTPTSNMNNNRTTTSAVLLPDGRVLVPAGFPGGQNTAETYHPGTGTWAYTGNLNLNRARQGAMLLPDGTALVAAGAIGGPPPISSETFDPATNTWTFAGNVAQPRFNYFFTELPNGKVLIAGGAGPGPNASTTSEVYDPATRTWASAGTLPNAHGSSSSNGNSTRMVVLTGGPAVCGQNCGKVLLVGDNPTGAAELYTPSSSFVCTTTITGTVASVNVPGGGVTCLNGATVNGAVTVQPGGSLVLNGARVAGGITSHGSTGIRICGSQIRSSVGGGTAVDVTGTVGPVVIGDGTAACARNDIVGGVSLDGNHQVELDTNRVSGAVSVVNTSGSASAPIVAANQVTATLDCAGNAPAPTNEGRPNTVLGARTGQCAAL